MIQKQDPWSGFDTLSKKPEKADPWAGFDSEASTAVADFGDFPEDPGVREQPGAGEYALGLVESGVRGAELSLGSVLDMVGGSGRRILDTYFPGDLTRAEKKRREERARKPGKDLKAYAEKEHPAPQDYPNKLMEGLGGVAPYLVAGAVTGGAGTPAILGTMGAQHISNAYDQALEATGSEAKATEAAIENIPGAAASMLPFGRILGKLAGTTPAVGGIVKEALSGAASGAIGNGAARVLGDIVHEQVAGEDREILKNALEGVTIDAPLFAFLGAVAGLGAKKPAASGERPPRASAEPLGPDDVQLGKPPTGPLNPELTGDAAFKPEAPALRLIGGPRDGEIVVGPKGGIHGQIDIPPGALESAETTELGFVDSSGAFQDSGLVGREAADVFRQPPKTAQDAPEPSPAPEPSKAAIVEPAKPQEAAGPEQSPTSTKNATVEAEREARGMAPVEQEAARDFGTVWDEAKAKLEEDPTLGDRVVAGEKLQALSADTRNAVLLRTQIEAQNEHKRVSDSLLKAQESGDADAVEALTAQHSKVSDRLLDIYNASKREGTEAGRGLNARRMMANEDFSLAAVETQMRIAKGGDKLTPEEQAKAASLSERLIAAERDVDAIEAAIAAKTADREARAVKASPEKQGRVLQFVSAQAEAARARIKARGSRAMAGFDPVDAADRVIVGVEYLAKDISAFVDWSKAMVQEFGEAIQPHLEDIFNRAKTAYTDSIRKSGALQGYKTRTAGTIEKLKGKIESEDFEPEPKRQPLPLDPEALKLKTNLEEVKREYTRELQAYRLKNRTRTKKVLDTASELTIDLPRAIKSSWDFSAVLRQGGFRAAAHPIEAAKILPEMFRATFSERAALEIDVKLRNRPLASVGEQAKLELTRHGDDIGKHEEAIRSKWSDKIPGIKASNRAFITFLNVQRATAFDAMYNGLQASERTPEAAKALANYINVATGRGNPGKAAPLMQAAGKILWAPRLLLSRFQLLAGQPMYRGTAATKKAIAKDYARALTALSAVYAMGKLAGGTVEEDPRSSDGWKIKFGDTRVDPGAGLFQVTRLLSTLITGERKNAAGELRPTREPLFTDGKGPRYGEPDTTDVIKTFLRTKLTPILGTAVDIGTGKNVVGEKVTPGSLAADQLPLAFQDIYDTLLEQGMEKGAALTILNLFGMGVSTYSSDKKREARVLSEVK